MSDKIVRSSNATQYYYIDSEGKEHDLDYLEPDSTPRFWRGLKSQDKKLVSIHFNDVRTRDIRFI